MPRPPQRAGVGYSVVELTAAPRTARSSSPSSPGAVEKELLTIATAFLAYPSLLILDEATISVDTRTDSLVQAMAALRSLADQLRHRPPPGYVRPGKRRNRGWRIRSLVPACNPVTGSTTCNEQNGNT
jgi:hypothetical protein